MWVFPREAPRLRSSPGKARPEAKETGPSNRKPIMPPCPLDSQAREGRAGPGGARARGAPRSRPRPKARRAPRPPTGLSPRWCPAAGRLRWGLEEKSAPCAAAVRNPGVTIVITIFILNDNDHDYLFSLDYTTYLGSGLAVFNAAFGLSRVPLLIL